MGKIKLNPNRKVRIIGYIGLGIHFIMLLVYLFWDGWHYEWFVYGYEGANQHFDWNVFGDLRWELIDGERVIYATSNLHNAIYLCYPIDIISCCSLILDYKWLRQSSMSMMAFPIMAGFSTINPFDAKEIFTLDIFYYHSYFLQIFYDLGHLIGMTFGTYNMYAASKRGEEVEYKYMIPPLAMTWVLFYVSRMYLQKWPIWDPENALAVISTNQINDMPFTFYGLEYIIVVALFFLMNFLIKTINRRIKKPIWKALVPFAIFSSLTVILVLTGLVVLQEIPGGAFIQ